MKGRESEMPDESYWGSFFNPKCILERLNCIGSCGDVVEFGCGYGHFTVAAGHLVSGRVIGQDIEPSMVESTRVRAMQEGLTNITAQVRDFLTEGSGLAGGSMGYTMLFNILHIENPENLLKEAYRVLSPGGLAGIIHWKHDAKSPRGPSLSIRPTPEQSIVWAQEAGFELVRREDLCCCSWHYGILMRKPH